MSNSLYTTGGLACPKCNRSMQRLMHGPDWRPRADQAYWFKYWDYCQPCRHVQHYEVAKEWRAAVDERQVDLEDFLARPADDIVMQVLAEGERPPWD